MRKNYLNSDNFCKNTHTKFANHLSIEQNEGHLGNRLHSQKSWVLKDINKDFVHEAVPFNKSIKVHICKCLAK